MDLSQLAVEHSLTETFPNPNPKGETPLEEFWQVRESLRMACQRFGRTGPEDGIDEAISFYVVEDQYNDDLYQYLAVHDPSVLSAEWLAGMIEVVSENSGWVVSIAATNGYVLVFPTKLVVRGSQFSGCHNCDSVLQALRRDCSNA